MTFDQIKQTYDKATDEKKEEIVKEMEGLLDHDNWGSIERNYIDKVLTTYRAQVLEEVEKSERDAFCTILEKLYRAGDDRKQMTWEYLMRIRAKEAIEPNPTN